MGVCGRKTLTLFKTKICGFPYPIYDLTQNLTPELIMAVAAGTVALNIIYDGFLP